MLQNAAPRWRWCAALDMAVALVRGYVSHREAPAHLTIRRHRAAIGIRNHQQIRSAPAFSQLQSQVTAGSPEAHERPAERRDVTAASLSARSVSARRRILRHMRTV